MNIRILLVDDYEIVREGLRLLLKKAPGLEIAGEADDGVTALAKAVELWPDVILMDMELGDMDGIEASRQILEALPETRIIVLSGVVDADMVRHGLKAGIMGFLVKTNVGRELTRAIRTVMEGESYFCEQAGQHPVTRRHEFPARNSTSEKEVLTGRERDVFKRTPERLRMNDIAGLLHIRVKTVEQALVGRARAASPVAPGLSLTGTELFNLSPL